MSLLLSVEELKAAQVCSRCDLLNKVRQEMGQDEMFKVLRVQSSMVLIEVSGRCYGVGRKRHEFGVFIARG